MIKKITILSVACLSGVLGLSAGDKIYIDQAELEHTQNSFKIHEGGNVWIETDTVHRDRTGLYTFEGNIVRLWDSDKCKAEHQRTWKCPYCHQHWPIGKACQNPDCPSKYK